MFLTEALQLAAQALADEVAELSLHTAGDIASPTDEAPSVARVPVEWEVTDGTLAAAVTFEGDPDLVVTRVGYWNVGGDYRGGQFLGNPDDPTDTALSGTGHLELGLAETAFSA